MPSAAETSAAPKKSGVCMYVLGYVIYVVCMYIYACMYTTGYVRRVWPASAFMIIKRHSCVLSCLML